MRGARFLSLACVVSAALNFAACCAESPREIWNSVMRKWEETGDLTCDLFAYINDLPVMKKIDGTRTEREESYVGVYDLRYTFRKPHSILMEFTRFKDTRKDMISKVASENPGLTVAFGYLNRDEVYAKFPPVLDNPVLNKHIEKTIYHAPGDFITMKSVDLSLVHTLGDLIRLRYHYFEDGTVTVEKRKYAKKTSFYVEDGRGAYREQESAGKAYVLTFIPDDPSKNNGITREMIMIDPDLRFPVQAEVYRGDTMIYCLRTENVKLNPGITDALWRKFYEGATIVETHTHSIPK
ncbi:MAG: hypothetical protein AB1742_12125 [bacterium]